MTTPSGAISMWDVNDELGFSTTGTISLEDGAVRALAGIPSGAISMSNLQSKTMKWSPGGTNGPTVSHANGGAISENTIYYDTFGSGTVSGYLSVVLSGSCSDSAVSATSKIIMYINGSNCGEVDSDQSGTPVTFNFTSGTPYSYYLASCNLSTLSVVIGATGGSITHLVDFCSSTATVSDIYFARSSPW